ncbi:MAG: hypothetical protein Q8R35_01935 [bacterium]|nr:hypothetical protein [bacterium]
MDAYGRYLMLASLLLLALVGIVSASLPTAAEAQTVGMYPYHVFEAKHLPVGAQVWANFGDNECAYPRGRNYPLAEDRCFEGLYLKARIQEVLIAYREEGKYYYAYRVRFESVGNGHGGKANRTAFLDDAFAIYNMPKQWAEWSSHFILLSW